MTEVNLGNQIGKALKEIHLYLNLGFYNERESNQDQVKVYSDVWKGDEHKAMGKFIGIIFPNLTNLPPIIFQHKNSTNYSKVN